MATEDLLILEYEGFAERARALTDELNTSASLRDRLLTDPTGVISEYLFPIVSRVSQAEINQANRFLYSLLSNEPFMAWAADWQARHREAIADVESQVTISLDKQQLYEELADAIIEFGDRETLHTLMAVDRSAEAAGHLEDYAEPALSVNYLRWPPPPKPVIVAILYVFGAAALIIVVAIPPLRAPSPEELSRLDLQRLSGTLLDALSTRAAAARQSGALRSVRSIGGIDEP
jgi:hypothetical protein